jgi:CelD/BcsL family acetyltransferase involved in cellulose biosynthesis
LTFEAMVPHVEVIWRALEARARPAYFLTWSWIENWLASLPADAMPEAVVLYDVDEPVGAFFVGRHLVERHGVFRGRGRFLNATGEPRFDALCIEHNGVLVDPRASCTLQDLICAVPGGWDELALQGVGLNTFPGCTLGEPLGDHRVLVDETRPAPFVDLARVRAAPGGYLSLLGSNTRAQIRRAERGFGELTIEHAIDEAHALDVYRELVRLHQASWTRKGQPGAFADPWFVAFHERLIRRLVAHGEIQLLRVRAGKAAIGCLYSFVANGRVLFYQSGFAEQSDARLKPGYVCHAKAVQASAEAGHGVYDFLAGRSAYKQSLATDSQTLAWARIQRPLARFRVEEGLRRWKRALLTPP